MKKIIAIAVAVFAFAAVCAAQPRAIGARIGWGGELSYQHTLGGENFLEADMGWNSNWLGVTGIYNFNIASDIFGVSGMNFYAGPGAYVGLWAHDGESSLNVAVAGQVGIEYNFSIPLQLSLDWRPAFQVVPGTGFCASGAALGIRYRF